MGAGHRGVTAAAARGEAVATLAVLGDALLFPSAASLSSSASSLYLPLLHLFFLLWFSFSRSLCRGHAAGPRAAFLLFPGERALSLPLPGPPFPRPPQSPRRCVQDAGLLCISRAGGTGARPGGRDLRVGDLPPLPPAPGTPGALGPAGWALLHRGVPGPLEMTAFRGASTPGYATPEKSRLSSPAAGRATGWWRGHSLGPAPKCALCSSWTRSRVYPATQNEKFLLRPFTALWSPPNPAYQ